ncbi:MAG: hypothetical protein KFH98_04710 [Gemmatimonadetes bacterium]|nr:hypothetical protein [Gemmatimonadota bacterium]
MSALEAGPVIALVTLGAVHGINPAMGWLFAVALGLQERRARAVWRALPPLALGHALAVAVVVLLGLAVGHVVPHNVLRYGTAAVLLVFGVHRLLRGHRHPRFGGMRVGSRDLTVWSFLMASAHGAGLMVLPFVMPAAATAGAAAGHEAHMAHAGVMAGEITGLAAAGVHTASYLMVTGILAVVVYERVGLRMLRTAWINLDVLWAIALIATALVTPFI